MEFGSENACLFVQDDWRETKNGKKKMAKETKEEREMGKEKSTRKLRGETDDKRMKILR